MPDNYKYDVAFSFLSDDEPLAVEIADRIRERVGVFIFSESQKELIGNDGIDQFGNVFREDSRLVVVLYREQWGQTKWTRIEETAIKTRWLDCGFEFLLMVPLETPVKLPKWYPPTWIWADIKRYGVDGVAGVIEVRVQSVGGTVRNFSAVDDANQLRNEVVFESARSHWRDSNEGVFAAGVEVQNLFVELQRLAKDISEQAPEVAIQFRKDGENVGKLYGSGFQLQLVWHSRFVNTLSESKLYAKIIAAYNMADYVIEGGEPKILRDIRYDADLSKAGATGWRQTNANERFFTSAQLADFLLRELISEIRRGGNHTE